MEAEETPKKTILCYGDCNTWGYIPGSGGARFPSHVRWPGVLSKLLRSNYRVNEEGLCGRTTVWDDPLSHGIDHNGLRMFGAILDTHRPLDLVIIALGTNDLKARFNVPTVDIAGGVERLVITAANAAFGPAGAGAPPDILVICPTTIWEVVGSPEGKMFKGGRERSMEMREAFHDMAARVRVPMLYAEDFVHSDPSDGIRLSAESHTILAQEVAKWVLEWFDGT